MQEAVLGSRLAAALPCRASEDSILDYGQYVILSTGNFMCSAPTINSTMDFAIKHIEDGVVDSPPEKKPRLPVSCSPSPLRSRDARDSSVPPNLNDNGTQRKLYGDANYVMETQELESQHGPDELQIQVVALPTVPPSLPRGRVLTAAGSSKRKAQGPCFSHSSTPTWDSWERKSLQAQRREHMRHAETTSKGGYSRGPEIMKAWEKMKSASRS
jgi:hypothetical protein